MRRVLLVCVMMTAGIVAAPGVARAANSDRCKEAVAQLKFDITALAPSGPAVPASSEAGKKLADDARTLFDKGVAAHPDCVAEFRAGAASLLSTSSSRDTPHGTPFLGPIGWLWNEIYYTIFQGNTVLMVMFGWELFLAPLILLWCALAVFRGTAGLLKKPYVPPELRTNER